MMLNIFAVSREISDRRTICRWNVSLRKQRRDEFRFLTLYNDEGLRHRERFTIIP